MLWDVESETLGECVDFLSKHTRDYARVLHTAQRSQHMHTLFFFVSNTSFRSYFGKKRLYDSSTN
jgi:hypothetical protein